MIKSLTVYQKPDKSDAFTMVLTNPINVDSVSGFVIDKIEGIGPVSADINTTEMVTDGNQFNSARIGERNVVITLEFYSETGDGIETVRQKSYKLFPIKKEVYIEVEADNRTLWTKGRVESNEPEIFSDRETAQISIICPDPKMYSTDTQTSALSSGETEVTYEGEVEVGTILVFAIGSDITKPVLDGVPAFTISCTRPDGSAHSIDIYTPVDGFTAGDTITINSTTGEKKVFWTDHTTDEDINAFNLISKDPDWITLTEGVNNILITDSESALSSVTMTNSICFEGV